MGNEYADDTAKRLKAQMAQFQPIAPPGSFFDSGTVTFTLGTQKNIMPRVSAARRKDPSKIQFQDLKVGDKVIDDGTEVTVKNVGAATVVLERANGSTRDLIRNEERLEDLGMRFVMPDARKKLTFDDVILPEGHKEAIFDAIRQIDNHDLIFNQWGFGDVLEKGKAISMLFYGAPGTGKTMIAQAIADKYNYTLKIISSAEIESSEPGQAERNIKAYFDAAQRDGKTLLLFDECDSLIADRRSVGMIIGAQINMLLTCLERYEGVCIFTTNRLEKMDEAFNRRLSLKLKFDMPTLEDRVKIWKRMFPKKAPLAKDVNWKELASLDITGGYIKNVVLRAARRAANSKERQITQSILIDALAEEIERMEEFDDAVASNTTPRQMAGDFKKGAV